MMNAYRMFVGAGLAFALLAGCAGQATAVDQSQLAKIKLPPGFRISVYARVPGARSMAVAPELNAVFVSTRGPHLYAVLDRDGDHIGKTVRLIARDLRVANGIAYHNGYLYVAEQRRVMRYRPRPSVLGPIRPQVLYAGLPDKPHHGWRYAAVGPDLKLYVTVGAPCNVCKPTGLEGSVVRMNLNGSALERFASGVRNSVGIDFHPKTGEAFFTDNGADRMGDDSPPDELNHAPKPGLDFGFPYYGGGHDVTPPYRGRPRPRDTRFPAIEFGVAALCIHFYRGTTFPPAYRSDAFVAQHGSWNRTVPDGYRVMRIRFDREGRATAKETFADGWLERGRAWGRPVDIKELADGSLLVSDDRAGVIYRITYGG